MPSLDGPKAKLTRAREHLDALRPKVLSAQDGEAYSRVKEVDSQSGDHVWRVKIDSAAVMRLGVLVGDAVHNLRFSLDHLVWQLALLTNQHPRGSEFPIYMAEAGPGRNCFDERGKQKV